MSVVQDSMQFVRIVWANIKKEFTPNGYDKSTRIFFIVVGLAVVGYGGFYAYRWHTARREATAQKMFSEALTLYDRAFVDPKQWLDVEGAFSLGYENNSSSRLAPFFQLFQADALIHQDKRSEAIALMETAIRALPSDSALLPPYQVKLALVKIDADDTTVQAGGLKALQGLAANKDNDAQEMAAYYLGMHYWGADDIKQARATWQGLAKLQKDGKPSPFGQLIQARLDQIK